MSLDGSDNKSNNITHAGSKNSKSGKSKRKTKSSLRNDGESYDGEVDNRRRRRQRSDEDFAQEQVEPSRKRARRQVLRRGRDQHGKRATNRNYAEKDFIVDDEDDEDYVDDGFQHVGGSILEAAAAAANMSFSRRPGFAGFHPIQHAQQNNEDAFEADLQKAIQASKSLEAQKLKQQQDIAFEQSLAEDQAKEREKREREETERRNLQNKEEMKRRKLQEKEALKAKRLEMLRSWEENMNPEPPADSADTVHIALLVPAGRFRRRFHKQETLLDLMRWVAVTDPRCKLSRGFEIVVPPNLRFSSDLDENEMRAHTMESLNLRRDSIRVTVDEDDDDEEEEENREQASASGGATSSNSVSGHAGPSNTMTGSRAVSIEDDDDDDVQEVF
eukprot:CAMPEP_0171521918 /NCGR_PEP_ID=MMETSP0959-20130129/7428_1 /TAXON_ID=87120 /ORGANISM="Aurantiochytrium limacinum, Strain ATCCMYA-1381" /LENGTH=387 /DNA_ID=CAMNT_0012061931 /DNA_START=237 /DNA_END=1400 /DNA_ORIENTATION=-